MCYCVLKYRHLIMPKTQYALINGTSSDWKNKSERETVTETEEQRETEREKDREEKEYNLMIHRQVEPF